MLHFLKDTWKFIHVHQYYYTMALRVCLVIASEISLLGTKRFNWFVNLTGIRTEPSTSSIGQARETSPGGGEER